MKVDAAIWVCQNCIFVHANGVDLRYESLEGMDYDPKTNPSPEPEPWNLIDHPVFMGLPYEEHGCGKSAEDNDFDCNCETREFSRSSCDGCGATAEGERYAFSD